MISRIISSEKTKANTRCIGKLSTNTAKKERGIPMAHTHMNSSMKQNFVSPPLLKIPTMIKYVSIFGIKKIEETMIVLFNIILVE